MKGSYQIESFTENKESEVKRLKAQVGLFFQQEFEIYKKIGLSDGMKVIECGCGPGYLLLNLAKQCPNSEFTGLEIDSYLYDTLKKNSYLNGKQVIEAKQGSIYETGELDNSFDIVITRLVIEHLDRPLEAIQELKRILKPDGKLIVVSNDFEYHVLTYPHIPELKEMYDAYCKSRVDEGGNPYVARELPVYLSEKEFQNIGFDVVTAHSKILGDTALLKAENVNISRSLVRDGYLKLDTLDALTNKWFEMLQDPNHAIMRQLFIVSGTKEPEQSKVKSDAEASWEQLNASELLAKPTGDRKDILTYYLIEKLRDFMDEESMAIEPGEKLENYYIDSLVATELASLLKSSFNTSLKLSDILRNYSLSDVVNQVLTNIVNTGSVDSEEENESWTEGEL